MFIIKKRYLKLLSVKFHIIDRYNWFYKNINFQIKLEKKLKKMNKKIKYY